MYICFSCSWCRAWLAVGGLQMWNLLQKRWGEHSSVSEVVAFISILLTSKVKTRPKVEQLHVCLYTLHLPFHLPAVAARRQGCSHARGGWRVQCLHAPGLARAADAADVSAERARGARLRAGRVGSAVGVGRSARRPGSPLAPSQAVCRRIEAMVLI